MHAVVEIHYVMLLWLRVCIAAAKAAANVQYLHINTIGEKNES